MGGLALALPVRIFARQARSYRLTLCLMDVVGAGLTREASLGSTGHM